MFRADHKFPKLDFSLGLEDFGNQFPRTTIEPRSKLTGTHMVECHVSEPILDEGLKIGAEAR
jgi:hypothetical protein